MSDETAIYQQAAQWLQQSTLSESLKARAIALVPTIPTNPAGMPYCRSCESMLCGACGDCHGLDLLPGDPECPNDHDTMGGSCAAWYQAVNAVWTVQRMSDEQEAW
jgi:hypothetical protein